MTTNHHTPIPSSPAQPANAATINAPLSQLDTKITDHETRVVNLEADSPPYSGVATEYLDGDGNFSVPAGTGSSIDGHVIKDEGVALPQRASIDFVGGGVTVTNEAGGTQVSIPGDHGLLSGLADDDHLQYLTKDGLREWDEQGSNPSTPATNKWKLFFKSGGLYIIDDAGNVAGPLKVGIVDNNDESTLRQRMDGYADFDYHFDDSSLPAGHSWAGAPFVTPSTVDLTSYPSVMFLQNTTGARSFLYTTTIPTNTSYLNCFINYVPNGKYGFVGVRYDDGTDNNYVELGLLSVVATWKHRIYYRTGGGSVNTLDGSNDITLPFAITHRTVQWGTKWSSWGVNLDVILPFQGTTLKGSMNKQSASSFAFTATRFGIVLRSDDQFICGIDAYGTN